MRIDPLGVFDRQAQPDRAAPVMHDDGHPAQVQVLQQPGHRVGVTVIGVPVLIDGLVRAPEARQVGSDAAKAGVAHRADDLPPQKRPRRLSVHEQDRRAVPFIEMGEPQFVVLTPVRREGKVGQPLEQARRECGSRRSWRQPTGRGRRVPPGASTAQPGSGISGHDEIEQRAVAGPCDQVQGLQAVEHRLKRGGLGGAHVMARQAQAPSGR